MIANIKGISSTSDYYTFTVKYKNYDGKGGDLTREHTVAKLPLREAATVQSELEAIVRRQLKEYLLLNSNETSLDNWTKLNIQIEEV